MHESRKGQVYEVGSVVCCELSHTPYSGPVWDALSDDGKIAGWETFIDKTEIVFCVPVSSPLVCVRVFVLLPCWCPAGVPLFSSLTFFQDVILAF